MTLEQAILKVASLTNMVGKSCRSCKGTISKVFVGPVENHSEYISYMTEQTTHNYNIERAESLDKRISRIEWEVYYICKNGIDTCWEVANWS